MHIGKMHFDERQADAQDGVAQRDAAVGKGSGVQDHEFHPLARRALYLADQLVFGIALAGDELMAQLPGQGRAALDYGVQRVGAVESGLPRAQQVQVGAIEQQ